MMIKKVTELRNLGKFESYRSSEISFEKFNGIYSENGLGKSTLTNVFRSFSERNAKILIGRKTIASSGDLVCKLETENGHRTFRNDAWDENEPGTLIFDAQFVSQNIYSGMHVGIDHRRRLYQFIIGEAAIHLNEKVNEIAQKTRDLTTKITKKEGELNKTIGKKLSIKEFVELKKIENIDEVIEAKAKEVKSLSGKEKISKKQSFHTIDLPDLESDTLKALLDKSIDDLAADSEAKVREHIQNHLDGDGEDWIKKGVGYLEKTPENCPFCASEVKDRDLVSAYRDFFNQAYSDLKVEIEKESLKYSKRFDLSLKEKVKKVISDNEALVEFWAQYLPVSMLIEDAKQGDYFPILTEDDAKFFDDFNPGINSILDRKLKSPLDKMSSTSGFAAFSQKYDQFLDRIEHYNRHIDGQNVLIQNLKKGLGSADIETEEKSLARLRLTKARHENQTDVICSEYIALLAEKEQLVKDKEAVRKELDEETEAIPKKYQEKINFYLKRFGADFRITDQRKVNPSGKAATEYKLVLKGMEIILGDNETPEDVTSFQNTLSEGDKSTLAFSYFLARLDSEESLDDKVLVFDDPITSLDRFRRNWTRNILRKFGREAKQLIILSHDPGFLEEMAYSLRNDSFKCLEIVYDAERTSSVLKVTTPTELNKNDHIRNLEKVRNYIKARTGSPDDIKSRLRPLCEHHLRRKYPQDFVRRDNLGSMIRQITEAEAADEIAEEKENLTDLEAINEFSTEESHSQDGDSGRVDETELTTNCRLTFELIDEPIPE